MNKSLKELLEDAETELDEKPYTRDNNQNRNLNQHEGRNISTPSRQQGGLFQNQSYGNQRAQETRRPQQTQQTYSRNTTRSEARTGMSESGWKLVFKITEVVLDIIKGGMIVGGIIASNLADAIMGSVAISFMIKPEIQQYTQYAWLNPMTFGVILSLGASSVQIYMWSLIQKKHIGIKTLINPNNWKDIPKEIRGFLSVALFLWAIDTFLDISPMFVFYTNVVYGQTGLYPYLVGAITIIVIMLCGFAEILTSNMRNMLLGEN